VSRARDLDLGSGHAAYYHASLIDIPHFIKIKETFLWMDGHTQGRTDGPCQVQSQVTQKLGQM